MRCRRSRVTELWSRGRRRGRGPGGGGSRPVRVRTAQHCGESWGLRGACSPEAPADEGGSRARGGGGGGPARPAHTDSLSALGPHSAGTANPRAPGEVPAPQEASSHAIGHWEAPVKSPGAKAT